MIRTLKKKFIVTAMIAVTVLLVVMLGAVNAVNAWSNRQEANELLELLTRMEANGFRPDRGEDGKLRPPPGEAESRGLLYGDRAGWGHRRDRPQPHRNR